MLKKQHNIKLDNKQRIIDLKKIDWSRWIGPWIEPQASYDELAKLLKDAEEVLQLLNLPYRVAALPTQDLSFAASKCYDLEAYAPGINMWLEVSSCSNFEAFQARRANIRYRREDKKLDYLHTLNG